MPAMIWRGKIDDSQKPLITFKKLSLNPSCLRGLLTISDWDKIRKGLTNSLHYVRSFFLSLINHFFSTPHSPQRTGSTAPSIEDQVIISGLIFLVKVRCWKIKWHGFLCGFTTDDHMTTAALPRPLERPWALQTWKVLKWCWNSQNQT